MIDVIADVARRPALTVVTPASCLTPDCCPTIRSFAADARNPAFAVADGPWAAVRRTGCTRPCRVVGGLDAVTRRRSGGCAHGSAGRLGRLTAGPIPEGQWPLPVAPWQLHHRSHLRQCRLSIEPGCGIGNQRRHGRAAPATRAAAGRRRRPRAPRYAGGEPACRRLPAQWACSCCGSNRLKSRSAKGVAQSKGAAHRAHPT